jgi:hypothetical protein
MRSVVNNINHEKLDYVSNSNQGLTGGFYRVEFKTP